MGAGNSYLLPPEPTEIDIRLGKRTPVGIIFFIEAILVFGLGYGFGKIIEVVNPSIRTMLSCFFVFVCLYLWSFLIYFLFLGGQGTNFGYVWGHVFIIYASVFVFTTIFIGVVPDTVRIFENTVGYYFILLTNSTFTDSSGKGVALINDIFYGSAAKEYDKCLDQIKKAAAAAAATKTPGVPVAPVVPVVPVVNTNTKSNLYNMTKLNGDFWNVLDTLDNTLYDSTYETQVKSIVNAKYNIGVLCWMMIATVLSTFLSMEHMSVYI